MVHPWYLNKKIKKQFTIIEEDEIPEEVTEMWNELSDEEKYLYDVNKI